MSLHNLDAYLTVISPIEKDKSDGHRTYSQFNCNNVPGKYKLQYVCKAVYTSLIFSEDSFIFYCVYWSRSRWIEVVSKIEKV